MTISLSFALLLAAAVPPADLFEPLAAADRDAPQVDEAAGAATFGRARAEKEPERQIEDLDAALGQLPRPTRFRGMVQCYRGWVLSELGRGADSDAAIEECYRLRPDDSYAQWEMASVLLKRRDLTRGVRMLIAAIKADPAPLANYDVFAMESALRELEHAREDGLRAELLLALTATEYGKDDPLWTSRHARSAIDGLLAKGDRAGAVRMLPLILVPRLGLGLLVDRRYEAIWPDVEAWAGGDLRAQRDAYVAAARAAFELDPSMALRRNYAEALLAAGRPDEAKALLAEALEDPKLWDKERYDAAMLAIRLAGIRTAEGDVEGALSVLRRLKATAPLDRYPAIGNVLAAEAQMLSVAGRHAEALALLDAHEPAINKSVRSASHAFIPALRVCALRGAGRGAEAERAAAALARDYPTNLAARRHAASCGAGTAERRRLWLESLDAPDARGDALLAWLEADRSGDSTLAADPQARAAFERNGRRLPPSFDDALMGWAIQRN